MSANSTEPSKDLKKPGLWISLLSMISAVGIHVYLTRLHYLFKSGMGGTDSICNINDKMNCNVAISSEYSELFGVPMAMFGALLSLILAVIFLAYHMKWLGEDEGKGLKNAIVGGTLVAALTSVVMGAITLTQLTSICLFCSITYLLSFLSLVGVWMYFKNDGALIDFSTLNLHGLKPGLIFAAVLVFSGFFFSRVYSKQFFGRAAQTFVKDSIFEWSSNPVKDIKTINPLALGASPDKAVMTIVEFADFRCGHCKNAYGPLKAFVQANPDVRLEFQAFPLDGACNDAIPSANGASCALAYFAYCAADQDKGWDAHQWIFDRQSQMASKAIIDEKVEPFISDLALDKEKFMECFNSEETKETIRAQAKLGEDVGVKGTPTIYANNKKLPGGQMIPVLLEAKKVSIRSK